MPIFMRNIKPSLNSIMDFDHVVRVHEDRSVTYIDSVSAPELWEGSLNEEDSTNWKLLTGFSGQDRYTGPIMHSSELIGGNLEDYILSHPGIYAAIVSNYYGDPDEDEDEVEVDGWAIAQFIGTLPEAKL
jgi:hypothetical protein